MGFSLDEDPANENHNMTLHSDGVASVRVTRHPIDRRAHCVYSSSPGFDLDLLENHIEFSDLNDEKK